MRLRFAYVCSRSMKIDWVALCMSFSVQRKNPRPFSCAACVTTEASECCKELTRRIKKDGPINTAIFEQF